MEEYAIKSNVATELSKMIYSSNFYRFVLRKIDEFRDLKLEQEIKKRNIPGHVAIIMDGNRRFAQGIGLKSDAGHIFGRDKIEEVMQWCFDLGIKNLTLYAFSTENFNRKNEEVKLLMELCKKELDNAMKDSRIHRNKVKIRIIGQIDTLHDDIKKSAEYIMKKTKNYDKYSLNIALAYGGREEIIRAIRNIARDVKNNKIDISDIGESVVSKYLYTNGLPDPDLILRTSGEERISNFLLWQLAYSELYFSDVFWPAFQKRDFLRALKSWQNRKRRFGK